jgi:predicted nucleic acid-binding protein
VTSAVLNASPFIVLARAGYLDLVPKLVTSVVIPRAVVTEVLAGPAADAAAEFLRKPSWLAVVDLTPPLSPLAGWRLGLGESEVLEYARRQIGTTAILDDRSARRAAHALGISVTGTLGVVAAAAQRGLLPSLADAINTVRKCGLYVDEQLVSRLLNDGSEPAHK